MESFPPNKKKIIIAVDGFSSCGKSTFAREVAARIGYIFIDTGAMYRAELKIFMTADPAIRAQRRYAELTGKGEQVTLEEVMQNLLERDHADQTRAISPLRKADDAIVLDNSFMTIGEELEWALELIGKLTA